MRPRFAVYDMTYILRRNFIFGRECRTSHSGRILIPNSNDDIIGELSKWIHLSLNKFRLPCCVALPSCPFLGIKAAGITITGCRSSLYRFVAMVSGIIPEKEMIWIAAWRIVAFMANMRPQRITSESDNKSDTMGGIWPLINRNLPVSLFIAICRPWPAFIFSSYRNLIPKSSQDNIRKEWNWLYDSRICHSK